MRKGQGVAKKTRAVKALSGNIAVLGTVKVLKEDIPSYEEMRDVCDRPQDGIVSVDPTQIKMLPHIFQPREMSYGARDVDTEYVNTLARRISIVGELDPPIVIRLGSAWVCVDGHHRIAAYKRTASGWKGRPIKCVWFGGTVREAVDEAIRSNRKEHLTLPQRDRLERAWKYVLLGDRSKAEIVDLCVVGEGTVASMRRIKKAYDACSDAGERLVRDKFRKNLGIPLEEARWDSARLAFVGVEEKERDDEEKAAKLAKRINSRLTDLLKRDPVVTARALEIYDPTLPRALTAAWNEPRDRRLTEDEDASTARILAHPITGPGEALAEDL